MLKVIFCNVGIIKRNSEYGFFCIIVMFSFIVVGIDVCDVSGLGICVFDVLVFSSECCCYGFVIGVDFEFF